MDEGCPDHHENRKKGNALTIVETKEKNPVFKLLFEASKKKYSLRSDEADR